MSYKHKYNKYKIKYLKLKNEINYQKQKGGTEIVYSNNFSGGTLDNFIFPVAGVIREIKADDKYFKPGLKIGIYIRGPFDKVQDDHTIYAPSDGKITYGPYLGKIKNLHFFSDQKKTGAMIFKMQNIVFYVYVGKGYVPDEIRLNISDGCTVKQGETIGEIVIHPLNSYAEIFVPYFDISHKINDVIIGGQTMMK